MSLHLTVDMLRATYELLRATPPFKAWKLPDGEQIEFHVMATQDWQGEHYAHAKGHHCIRISAKKHKTIAAVLATMAHEMVHLREHELGFRGDVAHGAGFHKLADLVCKHHGFDRGQF